MTSESSVVKVLFLFYVFNVEGNVILKSSARTFISFQNECAVFNKIYCCIQHFDVCLTESLARSRWKVVAQALTF